MGYKVKFVDICLMVIIAVILWMLSSPVLTESDFKHAQFAVSILTNPYGLDTNTLFLQFLESWKVWLYGIVFSALMYVSTCVILQPTDTVKLLGEVGYVAENGMNKKEMANKIRKSKECRDMPPMYANGWFVILESHQLKIAEAKALSCFGLHLAVFRGEDGRPYIIDGYCPHMGAHLAVGGQVTGNCLTCPFHGWKFNGESGKCVDIPYSVAKIPNGAKVKTHHCLERNNLIHLWYHAEGTEPDWEPPELQAITSGAMTYVGKVEHEVNVHIEEIPENAADLTHLDVVHKPFIGTGADLRYTSSKFWRFLQHVYRNEWQPCEKDGEKHMASLKMSHRVSVFGREVPVFDSEISVKQYGPALSYITVTTPLGSIVYLHSITTAEPMLQKAVFTCYVHWLMPTAVGRLWLASQTLQFERDIMIWNNKRFCMKPLLVKSTSDSTVAKHKKWFSQFYSENSPRFSSSRDTLDW